MNEFLTVIALASIPALGNFIGGLLAEGVDVSRRTLSLALHAAAGILLAVVGVELMPQALQAQPPWAVVLAFAAGGGFYILVDESIKFMEARYSSETGSSNAWVIFFGVSIDLFSDGVMIGAGSTIALSLGLLLALGQVSADIPEGFALTADFKHQGLDRARRMLLSAFFMIPVFLGATLGYWIVRDQPQIVKLSLLAFTAGILITLVVEGMMPEAHQVKDARLSALVFILGFALFTLLSLYLG